MWFQHRGLNWIVDAPRINRADVVRELEELSGEKLEVEWCASCWEYEEPSDTPLFKLIEKKITDADPGARCRAQF